ncbi:unnamed protein product [Sphagnum balticum]
MIQVSPGLTKFFALGPDSHNNTHLDAFYINYTAGTVSPIQFSTNFVVDPAHTFINLLDSFVYIRQLAPQNASVPNSRVEAIYVFTQNTIPNLASQNNISDADAAIWTKTLIQLNGTGNINVFTESLNGSQVSVQLTQVNQAQATANSNPSISSAIVVINGQLQLCPPGCSDCSSGSCTACTTGFVYDTNSGTCFTCALTVWLVAIPIRITVAAASTGLTSTETFAVPAVLPASSCNGGPNSCSTCPPGQYFDGSQCQFCSRNCLSCPNNSCTACRPGFILANISGIGVGCRGCIETCSSCSPSNITQCNSCAQGMELDSGVCVNCPSLLPELLFGNLRSMRSRLPTEQQWPVCPQLSAPLSNLCRQQTDSLPLLLLRGHPYGEQLQYRPFLQHQ